MLTITVKQQKNILNLLQKARDKTGLYVSFTLEYHIHNSKQERIELMLYKEGTSHLYPDTVKGAITIIKEWTNAKEKT